jgi:hypothetical protein
MIIASKRRILLVSVSLLLFISSCSNNSGSSKQQRESDVKESVQRMMVSISTDISDEGPVAWLKHFENSPGFFMASDGLLVFQNIDSASGFINNTLLKRIKKIKLNWNNIRIDSLSVSLAGIGADFHEDIIDTTGNILPVDGYFTAIAHQSSQGWRLRDLHWSIKSKSPK